MIEKVKLLPLEHMHYRRLMLMYAADSTNAQIIYLPDLALPDVLTYPICFSERLIQTKHLLGYNKDYQLTLLDSDQNYIFPTFVSIQSDWFESPNFTQLLPNHLQKYLRQLELFLTQRVVCYPACYKQGLVQLTCPTALLQNTDTHTYALSSLVTWLAFMEK